MAKDSKPDGFELKEGFELVDRRSASSRCCGFEGKASKSSGVGIRVRVDEVAWSASNRFGPVAMDSKILLRIDELDPLFPVAFDREANGLVSPIYTGVLFTFYFLLFTVLRASSSNRFFQDQDKPALLKTIDSFHAFTRNPNRYSMDRFEMRKIEPSSP